MSTDRKRLTSAIQRIAREDPEIRALLADYRNSGGKPSSSATTGSGAEDRQICCDGSSSGNANPGSGTRDPDDGGQDASDGLGDDPADISDMGGGSLTGVKDCDTGQSVCFEGSDWIPPDDWDSPTEPPLDPTYTEGEFWGARSDSSGTLSHQSPTKGGTLSGVAGEYEGYDTCYEEPSLGGSIRCTNDSGGLVVTGYDLGNVSCSSGYSGESYCNPSDSEIKEDSWPSDGCVNLAVKGGKLVGSKFDPENDGSYSKPRSEIQLCDDFGNQISIRPAGTGVLPTGEQTSVPERITGGWKTFSSTTNNGYLYDSSGKQIAHIDGNEYSDPAV